MGSKDERARESSNIVRTGAELARLTEADRDLAEQLVNRALPEDEEEPKRGAHPAALHPLPA